MSKAVDEPSIKSTCNQLVVSLFQIDSKLLETGVQQLDFTKKTHLKKIIIELENASQKGQHVLMNGNQNFISAAGAQGTSRLGSPDASFRDTQQSFTSQNTRKTIMSPGVGLNKRLARDRNSEVRTSRTHAEGPAAIITETPHELRKATIDQGRIGGVSWLDRKASDANKTVTLPSIVEPNTRKRQLGQGFIGNVVSGKAAGFNRDDFNATGNYSASKTGGILDYDFSQITANNGLGSGLITSQKNQAETFQLQSQRKPLNPMEMISPNASITKPLDNPDIDNNKVGAVRPPLYVPTHRTQNNAAKIEGYQPTLLERRSSQTTAVGEQGQGIEKLNGISQRYKQPSQLPALTATSFGTAQMQSTTTSGSQVPAFLNQNQFQGSQLPQGLNHADAAVKQYVDQVPQKRQSKYREGLNN